MKNTSIYSTIIISLLLIVSTLSIACTTTISPSFLSNQSITTSIPVPSPTPNPYGLDDEGYYIADLDTEDNYNKNLHEFFMTDDLLQVQLPNPILNATITKANISSGESLVFEGTSTLPPNTRVPIMIDHLIIRPSGFSPSPNQFFSAPVLAGINSTNIVKIKIPAFNIHLYPAGQYDFPENATQDAYAYFPSLGTRNVYYITITSNPNYPIIWEKQWGHPKGNYIINHSWGWMNDTTHTQHRQFYFYIRKTDKTNPELEYTNEYWSDNINITPSKEIFENRALFDNWFKLNTQEGYIHNSLDVLPYPTYKSPQ